MTDSLAVIAGYGGLPMALLDAYDPHPVFILAYHGHTDPRIVEGRDHIWLYLGQIGKALKAVRERNITRIVMAGGIRRPSLRHLLPDREGRKLLKRLGTRWRGDNKILSVIEEFLDEEGFSLLSVQEVAPHLLPLEGPLGKHTPSSEVLTDIRTGTSLLDHLSPCDIGQGLAIQNGLVLAIEAAEGTDACILRTPPLANPQEYPPIYIKRAKVNQTEKIDLPVIGLKTIENLAQAGFQGLVFQAKKTLITDLHKVIELANQKGIFLWGEP
jgi:DUF1009 family protein